MNPVVHFEIPYRNGPRAARFYSEAFGWKTQQLGPEMGDYIVVTTADHDAKPGMPAGAIDGGLAKRTGEDHVTNLVIGVDDIAEARARILAAGGTVHGEAHPIPGIGQYLVFTDPEGNRQSVLQPLPRSM